MLLATRRVALVAALSCSTFAPAPLARAAATIVVLNNDSAGEGFNDATPAVPIGGNTGTTLGQQRLIAVQAAFGAWGAVVSSQPTIVVRSSFDFLACPTAGGPVAVGSPSAWRHDFVGAGVAGTQYPIALANSLTANDLNGSTEEVRLQINSAIGQPTCLPAGFYLGLDDNHGVRIDLFSLVLHELAHGLGFQTSTNPVTGAQLEGLPSIFDRFALDTSTNKLWSQMSDAERAASARNPRRVVWTGANVAFRATTVLALGSPRLLIGGPAAGAAAGTPLIGQAAFGPLLGPVSVASQLMRVIDQPDDGSGQPWGSACLPLDSLNALAVSGRIALINLVDAGPCPVTNQVKNVQNAGALGAVFIAAASSNPPGDLSGSDPTVTIPSVVVTPADGSALVAALARRSRASSGVTADLGVNPLQRAGADPLGRPLLFTSDPPQNPAHWDSISSPNQLMEPAIAGDVPHMVFLPSSLTYPLLQDIGWP